MELKEYLEKVMEQEREAQDNALGNNAPEEVVAAIRRRLADTEEDYRKLVKQHETMEKNEWATLLDMANENLKEYDVQLVVSQEDNTYTLDVQWTGKVMMTEEYACGYYEYEMGELINEAWAHVRARVKYQKVVMSAYTQRQMENAVMLAASLYQRMYDKPSIEGGALEVAGIIIREAVAMEEWITANYGADDDCYLDRVEEYEKMMEKKYGLEEERPANDPAQEDYDSYSPAIRKAVAYINEQLEPEDKAIICAKVDKNFKQHMNPAYGIDEGKIIDLLEEYGEDHDLPEGWWMNDCDMDDIVLLIQFEN